MAFQIGMKESVRARIEYAGRVELTEAQAEQLWWVKRVMMVRPSACIPAVRHSVQRGARHWHHVAFALTHSALTICGWMVAPSLALAVLHAGCVARTLCFLLPPAEWTSMGEPVRHLLRHGRGRGVRPGQPADRGQRAQDATPQRQGDRARDRRRSRLLPVLHLQHVAA
jgi:hypothetical protein